MSYFLRNSSKAKRRLEAGDTEIPSFKDHIILPFVKEMCSTLFNKGAVKDEYQSVDAGYGFTV